MMLKQLISFTKTYPPASLRAITATSHRQYLSSSSNTTVSAAAIRSHLTFPITKTAGTTPTPLIVCRSIQTITLPRLSSVNTCSAFDSNDKLAHWQRELASRRFSTAHASENPSSSSPVSPFNDVSISNSSSNDDNGELLAFSSWTPKSPELSSSLDAQDPTLPMVQITRDSTSLILIPPPGSRFSSLSSQSPSKNPSLDNTVTAKTLEYTWLRDNCPCPRCLHAPTQKKLHSTEQIPQDISVSSIQVYEHGLEVTWSKGLKVLPEGVSEMDKEEASLRAKSGHQSFYPWEMIFAQ